MDAYRYIIDSSDMVLAVYDAVTGREGDVDRAMRYADGKKRPILYIHPDMLGVKLFRRDSPQSKGAG